MDILIVESDTTTSDLIDEVMLNTEAFAKATIARALTADQARNLLETMPFDLIVVDLMVPGFNPLEVLPAFRRAHPSTPIIAIAGAIEADQLSTLHAASVYAVLLKPVRPEDLQPILQGAFLPAGPAPAAA